MNDFKIGDFVSSHTDDVFIGIIIGETHQGLEVAWNDGDFTYNECEGTMSPYEIQPSDWTHYLYKAFSDIICP
jgi:hypothetical protein